MFTLKPPLPDPAKAVDRRSVLIGLLAVGCWPALSYPARAAEAAGRVRSATGRSTGLLNGSLRDLTMQADVFLQELVQTGRGPASASRLARRRASISASARG